REHAIFMLDPNGFVATWNPGAERVKGYRTDEALGLHFSRFYPPDRPRAEIDRELEVAQREGVFRELGWRLRKDGSRFWADVTITPVRDERGVLVGFAKVTGDLSARKAADEQRVQLAVERAAHAEAERAHARLHEAHEQLRLVFQGIAEGILVQGHDGRVVLANDTAARMCGFAGAAEMAAACVPDVISGLEIFDEQGAPFPHDALPARRALRGEERVEAVMRFRVKSSQAERWAVNKATPLRDDAGKIVGAVSIFEDVTERRRLTARLRFLSEAGELLASSLAYEETLAAVARLSVPRIADWCTVDVVAEGGRLRRLAVAHVEPAKEAWARELEERYPTDLEAASGVGAVLRTGRSELRSEVTDEMLEGGAKDPEHLRVLRELGLRSYICVPLKARARVVGALTLLTTASSGRRYDEQDLTMAELLGRRAGLAVENARLYTETQTALSQATESSRLKDDFLATLSHELRTPLNAIVGWAHILKSGALDAEFARKGIETIDRNAAQQSRLIDDILDVSRIITGNLRLNVRPVHPLTAIEHAVDTVRPAAAAKDIRIETILDPSAGPISGDEERLQQILWNLLSNAVKFTPKGGRVQVRLEAVGSHIAITVEDSGPGIEAGFLPYLFQRFRQADSSSTRAHGGLGLGLALVRHLVELHGGGVRAENRAGGSGAVFVVDLPRRSVAAGETADPRPRSQAASSTPGQAPVSLQGVRVMLVDDEADARELLGIVLEQSGATVLRLPSADAAVAALPEYRPHVLLADIEMPDKDGYSLVQSIRRLPPEEGGLTPSIAITAYAGVENRIRALAAGFDLHLPKPVQLDELTTAVARLAGRHRQLGS
ncbi:MAG TPA: ATP-binding protein, partial [Vicinamibacteria bacterium]|nr:ATP-binding protein [Vicinamibacteria bacterium]